MPSRRPTRGDLRLSQRAHSIATGLKLGNPLGQSMNPGIEAARVLQKSGEVCCERKSAYPMP
jgi:hypothetical protein